MSAPLKLLSSMATRDLLVELAACCARDLSQPVVTEATGGVDVAKRVQNGEAVDIVVLASNAIDKLISEGKLRSASRVDLAKSGIAIAVASDRILGRPALSATIMGNPVSGSASSTSTAW